MYRIVKISLLLLLIISVQGLFGQTVLDKIPNGIAIQSVARDASGNAASNRNIFLKVDLRQGSATGESVLIETHSVTSNDEGIFNFYIGQGARVSGTNSLIFLDWKGKIYFLNIKMAIEPSLPTPGWVLEREYVDLGTSQIWSVPYAFTSYRSVVADSAMNLAGIVSGANGGTGISNPGRTIILGKDFEIQGLGNLKFNTAGPTNLTLPLKGTLVTSESLDTLINKYLLSPTFLGTPKTPTVDPSSNDSSVASTQFVKSVISSEINSLNNKLSTTLDTSAGAKLKIADTAAMLTSRFERDTASLSNRINLKVNTLNARIDSSLYVKGLVNIDSLVTINDSLRVKGNVLIDTNLTVGKDLEIKGNLILNKGLDFNDSLVVQKGARIEQSILAKSKLYVADSVLAKGNVKIDNNLNVGKITSLNDSLYVKGQARFDSLLTINDSLRVKGNVLIDSNLTVGKDLEIKGNLILNKGLDFNDSLVVQKGARIEQSILAKSKLYVADSILARGNVLIDSNLTVGKDLYVKGQARFDSLLRINDSLRVKGNVLIDSNLTVGKDLEIKGNLILNKGLDFNDSLVVQKGARIEQSILANSKLYVADSILAKGTVKIDNDLIVKGLKINDSIMKYDTSKVNVIDTAAMLNNYARKFTKNVKLNLAAGRTLGKYNVGDSVYVKGKTLDEFLYDMTNVSIPATYSAPTVSVSSNKSSEYEIGTNMTTVGPVGLSYSYNQRDGGTMVANSEVFYKNGTTLGAGVSSDASAGTLSGTSRYLTTSISYSVNVSYNAGPIKNDNLGAPSPTGQIGASNVTSGSITISPFQNIYWGVATNPLSIDYLQNPAKSSVGKAKSFSMTGLVNQHIFYAYPVALGALTAISIGGFDSKNAFDQSIINLTNASGYTAQYYLYVSQNYFNGSVNNIIFQ